MSKSSACCVVVVDDDEDDQFIISQAFQRCSPECQLKTLGGGSELLTTLDEAEQLPSLILLDLNMPRMSGLETLKRIRQQSAYQSLPVVILTTSDQASDRQAAADWKANGFITKPATMKGYNEVIERLQQDWLSGRCLPC